MFWIAIVVLVIIVIRAGEKQLNRELIERQLDAERKLQQQRELPEYEAQEPRFVAHEDKAQLKNLPQTKAVSKFQAPIVRVEGRRVK